MLINFQAQKSRIWSNKTRSIQLDKKNGNKLAKTSETKTKTKLDQVAIGLVQLRQDRTRIATHNQRNGSDEFFARKSCGAKGILRTLQEEQTRIFVHECIATVHD